MDNACVIGYGMVGKATADVFGIKKHFDVQEEKSNISLEEASKCRFVFLCLPTPVDADGSYKQSEIRQMIEQLEGYGNGSIYIIRSTVAPGFAVHLQKELTLNRIISNPEFLSEATALKDAKNPPFVIIGGLEGVFRKEVRAFYEARLKGSPVIETDNTTAEMIKLSMNAYFATKVIFANQLYDACRKLGANYETVKKAMEKHPFGPNNHFAVWFREKRGVNGNCLPKDAKAFAYYANSDLVKKVLELNETYKFIKEDNEI
jgi:UDPglucose 6-dehydrogenase